MKIDRRHQHTDIIIFRSQNCDATQSLNEWKSHLQLNEITHGRTQNCIEVLRQLQVMPQTENRKVHHYWLRLNPNVTWNDIFHWFTTSLVWFFIFRISLTFAATDSSINFRFHSDFSGVGECCSIYFSLKSSGDCIKMHRINSIMAAHWSFHFSIIALPKKTNPIFCIYFEVAAVTPNACIFQSSGVCGGGAKSHIRWIILYI